MMKNKITRVCIVDTIYTLFIYLLYSTKEELDQTYFFFSTGINKSIREKFIKHYFVDTTKKINKSMLGRIILLGIIGHFRWRFLKTAEIFGHDHLYFSAFIIRKRDYTYIEDGPKVLSHHLSEKLYSDLKEFWQNKNISINKIVYSYISGVYKKQVANNKQCKALILTVDDDVPYIAGKTKCILPLDTTWENIAEEKRQYILGIYDVSKNDIAALQEKTHIILTQQFSVDKFISEAEQIKIYRQIIEQYDQSCLVIKTHPRDTVDYRKYFPNVFVFDKQIPMQLLLLIGVSFKKAITVCSSSIAMFPDTVEKEWIGSAVHPALHERYPNLVHNNQEKANL